MSAPRFGKVLVGINGAVPVALLLWDAAMGRLGANPVNFAIRTTGLLCLIFLLLSLTVTPASRLSGWSWLGGYRRILGLYAFFHAALHFAIFFGFDRAANIGSTVSEILSRYYLMVGFGALVLMVPLAITSTDRMIKRLGPKRWKRLHYAAYPIAIAAVLHFAMLVKADLTRPLAFAAALGILFAYRLVAHYVKLRADAARLRSAAPAVRPKFWTGPMRVARVFVESPGVRTFRFVPVAGGLLPFDFLPGQYLTLTLTINGQRVKRSYTIASPPSRVGSCEITVKREDDGTVSRHLHDTIAEGAVVEIAGPGGKFTFTGREAEGLVMIAAGVGITPLMSKIRYLTDIGWPGPIDLVYSARTADDVIFRDELSALQNRFPNLRVAITLTRGEGAGRLTADTLRRLVPHIAAARRVHFCGPAAMAVALRDMLAELGVPSGAFFEESFTPARRLLPTAVGQDAAAEVPLDETTVTFQRAGKTVPITATQTVLEVAEQNGIAINYDCRAGVCGQCKTPLLEGRVVMETQDALDPADRAGNLILSCQARCLDPVVVDA